MGNDDERDEKTFDMDDLLPPASKVLAVDEALPPQECLACLHGKWYHCGENGACRGKRDQANSLSDFPSSDCWCQSFTDDLEQANIQILKHGNDAALVRGINEAFNRQDWNAVKSLRIRYLQVTPKDKRDDPWLAEVDPQEHEPRARADAASKGLYPRSSLKREIWSQLIKNPKASDFDICEGLDEEGVEVPATWTTGNDDRLLFVNVFSNPQMRKKLEPRISEVRRDMRERGLLVKPGSS